MNKQDNIKKARKYITSVKCFKDEDLQKLKQVEFYYESAYKQLENKIEEMEFELKVKDDKFHDLVLSTANRLLKKRIAELEKYLLMFECHYEIDKDFLKEYLKEQK